MKKLTFKTKVDVNGNIKLLDVDLDNRTYCNGYGYRFPSGDDIVITAAQYKQIIERLQKLGFQKEEQ